MPDPAMTPDVNQIPQGCDCTEPPESGVVQRLFRLHHVMMRLGDRLAAPFGLTSSRWMVVCSLGRCEQAPTVSELSETMMLSPQNLSRMIVAMEGEGLIERFADPAGGRAARLRLTESGERARQKTFELRDRFLGPFMEGFEPDRRGRLEADLDDMLTNLARFEERLSQDGE
ncbi:MAG: hypothetical protein DHS20C14_12090 [Phycisphaeraceae bacterium]|nr:MAG: hypothetical protein DHS20C14_12090 [Phycisphaeraceae bacterium]